MREWYEETWHLAYGSETGLATFVYGGWLKFQTACKKAEGHS